MVKLLLSLALLLPAPLVRAQEEEEEAEPQSEAHAEEERSGGEEAPPPAVHQGVDKSPRLGGAGIDRGRKDAAEGVSRRSGAFSGGNADAGGAASGACAEEDLNWRPGKGGPATSVEGQAMRAQPQDTTIAYRVRASQLGEQGNFGFYTDSHTGSFMRLSNRKCEVSLKVGPCEASYGSVTLRYLSAAMLKKSGFSRDAAAGVCVIPAPAGRVGGEDYWWLNVHTKGPCHGGSRWFGGGELPAGVCARAILYEGHGADGQSAGSSGGGSSGGGAPPAPPAPQPNRCWKAASGRICCDVMFSPVPMECARR